MRRKSPALPSGHGAGPLGGHQASCSVSARSIVPSEKAGEDLRPPSLPQPGLGIVI